jgi:cyclopentanol dehydrogenase
VLLDGRVAVITGGARGFGRATAELFAREGATVAIGDLLVEEGSGLAAALAARGSRSLFVPTDVTVADEMKRLIEAVEGEFGRLDVLVANAGVLVYASVEELSEESYRLMLDTNLKGVWLAIKYALPALRRGGGGSIIVTSSSGAERGSKASPLYAAGKAAAVNLARTVASTYAADNVRCNVVSPGPAPTGIFAGQGISPDEFAERTLPGIPLGRLGRPVDVANAMLFFASDRSEFCTGAVLAVDGGQSL